LWTAFPGTTASRSVASPHRSRPICRKLTADPCFVWQRKTGYVQQQDLHLETATVRESLQFSALLRQPKHVPREEKLAYAEEILVLLGMDKYADAVVGVAGEGLNVEERKRLSIGQSDDVWRLAARSDADAALQCRSRDGRQA
jgi:hypothetical protein